MFKRVSAPIAVMAFVGLLAPARRGDAQYHPGPAPAPNSIEVPADGISLPMDDFGGRPVVDVEIGGKGPYRFIVDTGATVTVINPRLQEELALPAAPGMRAAAPGGGPAHAILSIPELRIGQMVIRGLTAVVLPGGPLKGENVPPGVLSGSSFPGYLLTFDYPRKRISIRKGELARSDSQSIFDYPEDGPLPTVPIRVAGREIRAHLDTGSGHGLTLPLKVIKELPLDSEPKEAGMSRTHLGEFPVSRAKVKGPIELGQFKLDMPDVSFADVRSGADASIGNVGYEVLRDFAVTLDSKNRRIAFDRP
jgi:predicted aspartyl protease